MHIANYSRLVAILIAATVLALACNSAATNTPVPEPTNTPAPTPTPLTGLALAQFELDTHRNIWDQQSAADYRYGYRRNCFCIPEVVAPVLIVVRDNSVDTVHFQASDEYVPDEYLDMELYTSIDGLFDIIQDAIDEDAAQVSVDYSPDFGYPQLAFIDYSELIADEELGWSASDLILIAATGS